MKRRKVTPRVKLKDMRKRREGGQEAGREIPNSLGGSVLSSELTLLESSPSSSLMELEGEGVADLLAGGEGDVWGKLAPPKFNPNWALS